MTEPKSGSSELTDEILDQLDKAEREARAASGPGAIPQFISLSPDQVRLLIDEVRRLREEQADYEQTAKGSVALKNRLRHELLRLKADVEEARQIQKITGTVNESLESKIQLLRAENARLWAVVEAVRLESHRKSCAHDWNAPCSACLVAALPPRPEGRGKV